MQTQKKHTNTETNNTKRKNIKHKKHNTKNTNMLTRKTKKVLTCRLEYIQTPKTQKYTNTKTN